MDWIDGYEEGMLSAVLDMDEVELFLSGRHSSASSMEEFVMPGAQQVGAGILDQDGNDFIIQSSYANPFSIRPSLSPSLCPILPAGG
jgi:hypothetical protein